MGLPDAAVLLPPSLMEQSHYRLTRMRRAADEVIYWQNILARGGQNVVSDVLRGAEPFVEWQHYPQDDAYDTATTAQYYYHAHAGIEGEHGHFHTFLRSPQEPHDLVHLVAISMDSWGTPQALFAVNHWVTGGLWQSAHATLRLLPHFRIDHAYPSWPVNRWIASLLQLFYPHIKTLLSHRDTVISTAIASGHSAVHQDERLAITGILPIDVPHMVTMLNTPTFPGTHAEQR